MGLVVLRCVGSSQISIKSVSSALTGGFLTTRPPGKLITPDFLIPSFFPYLLIGVTLWGRAFLFIYGYHFRFMVPIFFMTGCNILALLSILILNCYQFGQWETLQAESFWYDLIIPELYLTFWEKMGFPSNSDGKESACSAVDLGLIPRPGRFPGEGNNSPLQLAWKIPWTEEPGRLQTMGSQRVVHDWATNTHMLEQDVPS